MKYFYSILLFLLVACGTTHENRNTEDKKEKQKESNKVLLAVTGFGNTLESISFDSLKTLYNAQKVYVFKDIQAQANNIFKSTNHNISSSMADFRKLAKDNIMIVDLEHLSNEFKALAIDSISFFKNASKYPLYTTKEKFVFDKEVTKFILTGVTAITRSTGMMADKHGPAFIVDKVKDYFQDADYVHISNEVSFYPNCDYHYFVPNVYRFCSKERDFEALKLLNTNIIELTGNHNLDFGVEGYEETYAWYQQNKMQIFGGGLSPQQANTPLIIQLKDGSKMAFIGFNETCPVAECADSRQDKHGANQYNKKKARKVIEDLKHIKKIDIVFASVQFAEIDAYHPTEKQFEITHDLVDFGADFVYGSQAHQVQKVEFYKGKPIFHGLGNFLFDQVHRIGVKQAFFLENYIYKGKVVQSIPIFTMISQFYRPEIATKKEADAIKKEIYKEALLYK